MINSNMTYIEHFNMHGSIPVDDIEKLVFSTAVLTNLDDQLTTLSGEITESQLEINEDFLHSSIEKIQRLIKRLTPAQRKAYLDDLDEIVIELEDIERHCSEQYDCHIEKIQSAQELIKLTQNAVQS